jgi:hypothetical protein
VIGVFYRPALLSWRGQKNRFTFQQLLESRAGKIGQGGSQETVQPPTGMIVTGKCGAPVD